MPDAPTIQSNCLRRGVDSTLSPEQAGKEARAKASPHLMQSSPASSIRSFPSRPALAGGFAAVACFCACAGLGSPKSSEDDGAPKKPIAELVEATNTPVPIGQLLAQLDLSIQRWNELLISGTTRDDHEKARKLELWIQGEAHRRRTEIIEQLETGAPQNRTVAAMALGLTREAEAQSPLIAALGDPEPAVVSNALLGLGLLGRSDTPLDQVCVLLRTHADPALRSNAALCMAQLTGAGARADCALEAARFGLLDTEPTVRSHCALALGNLLDKASVDSLVDHLTDPVPLVAAASAKALGHIGKGVPTEKGKAARALVGALDGSKGIVKDEVRRNLLLLAGVDHGKETKDWLEWAVRLP